MRRISSNDGDNCSSGFVLFGSRDSIFEDEELKDDTLGAVREADEMGAGVKEREEREEEVSDALSETARRKLVVATGKEGLEAVDAGEVTVIEVEEEEDDDEEDVVAEDKFKGAGRINEGGSGNSSGISIDCNLRADLTEDSERSAVSNAGSDEDSPNKDSEDATAW